MNVPDNLEETRKLKEQGLELVQNEIDQTTDVRKGLERAKRRLQEFMKGTSLEQPKQFFSNSDLIEWIDETNSHVQLLDHLTRKHTRTLSGICVVAVMTSPEFCPHGTCIYCPGGPTTNTPQSYTGLEPAARRGKRNQYDSFSQTQERIKQLQAIGHQTDKVEVIVMGGTFTARPVEYQHQFIKGIYDALNGLHSKTLQESIEKNVLAHNRCVGLTLETRPHNLTDAILRKIIEYGTTRCEIGVQIIDDSILKYVNRGHTVEDIENASHALKQNGLKLGYHIMPNLPQSSLELDLKLFQELFKNAAYQPDFLKIYPTLVIRNTGLFKLWEREKYHSYTLDETIQLLAEMLRSVPEYVRVHRIQRDIPASQIVSGCTRSNLYELVMNYLDEQGWECRCIRCREVGYRVGTVTKVQEVERTYASSNGTEKFLSFEGDNDSIISYLRLRFDQKATVRELRTVGKLVGISEQSHAYQSRGYGKELLRWAEDLAKAAGFAELRIISGIGVREYYRSQGYLLDHSENPGFMIKKF